MSNNKRIHEEKIASFLGSCDMLGSRSSNRKGRTTRCECAQATRTSHKDHSGFAQVKNSLSFSLTHSLTYSLSIFVSINDFDVVCRDRVRVISSDIALVQFGLSEEHYHFLTYGMDVVVHAAAYVNLIYPYQALHGINVLGTRNVLDFCLKNKIKPLHYIR